MVAVEILPGLWMSDFEFTKNGSEIKELDISVVLNCTQTFPFLFESTTKIRIPLKDTHENENNRLLLRHFKKITMLIKFSLFNKKNVLVFCHKCVQRSPTVILAYLIEFEGFDPPEGIRFLRSKKRNVFMPFFNFEFAITEFYKCISNDTLRFIKLYYAVNIEKMIGKRKGVNPKIWGRSMWVVLRSVAYDYPEYPTEYDKQRMFWFLQSLPEIIPCWDCRKNTYKNMRKLGFDRSVVESGYNVREFVEKLNDQVQQDLEEKAYQIKQKKNILARRPYFSRDGYPVSEDPVSFYEQREFL